MGCSTHTIILVLLFEWDSKRPGIDNAIKKDAVHFTSLETNAVKCDSNCGPEIKEIYHCLIEIINGKYVIKKNLFNS
jgi:hypothetical protein